MASPSTWQLVTARCTPNATALPKVSALTCMTWVLSRRTAIISSADCALTSGGSTRSSKIPKSPFTRCPLPLKKYQRRKCEQLICRAVFVTAHKNQNSAGPWSNYQALLQHCPASAVAAVDDVLV